MRIRFIPLMIKYTFGKQHKQIKQLMNNINYIITDSLLLLSLIYGNNEDYGFKELVKAINDNYNNYHFVLNRNHKYSSYDRLQNEREADDIRHRIKKMLDDNQMPYISLDSTTAVDDIFNIMGRQQ